ncbi:helix-turn-helix transcriptional regulator [Crossiella sp. SN42]|uniref:helix-turn-helix domain-containing protein n=1 Tax=Crossiella sp. SN42 TaxID=2944808 RepID=UPI00207C9F3B|nr:helix-turn-helix transcriptional regulator [Crossiella sp. SN42]MCO1580511.1 helix-turn-helix transcriptional regulator [Crossiella sp. SN42]
MARPELPLDPSAGPLYRFAADLRSLRAKAGSPPYRELARQAHFSITALSDAARGNRLPTLPVLRGYVRACGGDVEEWAGRWRELAAAQRRAKRAGAGGSDRKLALWLISAGVGLLGLVQHDGD